MRLPIQPSGAPLKLSILTQFFPPDYAATGQLIEELARAFSRRGVQVQVYTGQPGYAFDCPMAPKQETAQGMTVRRTRTSRIWPQRIRGRAVGGVLFCLRALVKLINPARRGQLLLVTTEPPYLPVLAYMLHWLFNQRYVCVVADLYRDVAVALGVVPNHHWIVRCWRWLNRRTWRHAEAVVVLSPTMKQRVAALCPEAEERITVIHNWSNPREIVPLPKQENWFAQQHGLDQVFTVLYSGNMGRCHDMDTIMAAAAELRDEPIRFVFIGAGAKRQPCQQWAEEQGLGNCLFLPYQSKETLPFSLTACDLSLVSLGADVEGLVAPSKLYGCLAAGRPVAAICEPHSYLRPLLREGKCGEAFSSGDGAGLARFIQELAANPAMAAQMGARGRRYMEANFTPEHCANQYMEVVNDCLGIAQPIYGPEPEVVRR